MPSIPSNARQPRSIVKLAGAIVPGFLSWEVENNLYRYADRWRVVFSLKALPNGIDAAWFSSLTAACQVEILAGFPGNPDKPDPSAMDSLIMGNADEVRFDPARGIVEMEGRDFSALMIDTKASSMYRNQTASDVATAIAQAHGLTPVVTATTTKVGGYYEIDNARMISERSEWDLLGDLAQHENFVCYVKGQTLYFGPPPDPASAAIYPLRWADGDVPQFPAMRVEFCRNLTLSRDIEVTVKSWNQKKAAAFARSARATKNGVTISTKAPSVPKAGVQYYSYTMPNLTPDQAAKRATSILAELTKHEMRMEIELPADNVMSTTSILRVTGTNTAYDQDYYPEAVRRRMSADDGYLMMVTAKNTSPDTVTIPQ